MIDKELEKIAKSLNIEKEQVTEIINAIKENLGISNIPEEETDIIISQLFS